jgi:ketosteroid isomerase-like protein
LQYSPVNFGWASLVLAVASVLTLAACGGTSSNSAVEIPAAFGDRQASGEALANAWFALLEKTGSAAGVLEVSPDEAARGAELVKPYLDPAFQLQRSTGQRYTRESYLPSDIDQFEISDVRATKPREGVQVLRYTTRTPGATLPDQGVVLSDELMPRLTVLRWDDELGRWLIVSHANFNTPVQAVCNQKPIVLNAVEVATPSADRELGEKLVRKFYDLLESGDGRPLMHTEVQGQTASGAGYTTVDEYTPGQLKSANLREFVVTRSGDLLVVSVGTEAQGTVFANSTELGTKLHPRLLTFMKDEQGEWKLVAIAIFNVPAEVPAGVDCASSTN